MLSRRAAFFYIELCNKKAERNKKAIYSDEGIAKLWDPNDPECIETMAFIRTIKPIDFKGVI